MKGCLFFLFILVVTAPVCLSGEEWSKNNVIKFTPSVLQGFQKIMDYENIQVLSNCIVATAPTNAWLTSYDISVGKDFILSGAFINIEKRQEGSNSSAVLKVLDSDSDRLIQQKTFYKSGKIDLINVFIKNVTLTVELTGTNFSVLSYGLVRQPEVIITTNDLVIYPAVLFYGENILKIDFFLHYPANLDVILFDKSGKIIGVIAKNEFFSEGHNSLYWEPASVTNQDLLSGKEQIYFKVKSTDGKITEILKDFIFVKN